MSLVNVTLPDGTTALVEMSAEVVGHAVDQVGEYLGLVAIGEQATAVPGPPPAGAGWLWVGQAWQRTLTLAELQTAARSEIDAAAGQARLRHITDVPGQQAVYLLKLQEAQSYLQALQGNPAAIVPAHIAAEAAATGEEAVDVAQMVVGLANYWNGVLSPAIEGARMGAKTAVNAAADAPAVLAARAAGLAALAAI